MKRMPVTSEGSENRAVGRPGQFALVALELVGQGLVYHRLVGGAVPARLFLARFSRLACELCAKLVQLFIQAVELGLLGIGLLLIFL